jgi:hypothetical protein
VGVFDLRDESLEDRVERLGALATAHGGPVGRIERD